eukprot:CAMPEP_0172434366 /NCGR_PEP_ID=MMETSP1064-20121228/70593_1 /TAXON_ID=202472 /ORGANISM="Aulacoseira subarctica , Strain CCAP 1002/5" /LENGTH=548 /DNA_ID=CAMNT_0013182579 /DNA_START=606 /DNA_END=2252 /DNA_ORIENTATION=-
MELRTRVVVMLLALSCCCIASAAYSPSPTASPTASKWPTSTSQKPTSSPSAKVTKPPTGAPVKIKTRSFTTAEPSSNNNNNSPSPPRNLFKEVYLITTISNILPMNPSVVQKWQDVTTDHVYDYWSSSQRVTKLTVDTFLTLQDPPFVPPKQARRLQTRRQLQQQPQVTITFRQNVTYQVPMGVENYPTPDYICTEPFATFALRSEYIDKLKNSSSHFQNITTVSQFRVTDPPPPPPKKPWYAQVTDQPIIIAAVGGGVVLILVALFIFCICRGRNKRADARANAQNINANNVHNKELVEIPLGYANARRTPNTAGTFGSPKNNFREGGPTHRSGARPPDARMDSFIEVKNSREDDISTLGDPLSPYENWRHRRNTGDASTLERDETVGPSIINDFDYTKTFGGKFDAKPEEVSNNQVRTTGNYNNSNDTKIRSSVLISPVTADQQSVSSDGSFDQAFEAIAPDEQRVVVMAPPGKLGVVIDTFDNGEPGVNSIRDDSVLRDQLKVGDILVEFDGVDTTEMTALQVSTLIGEKSKNPVRKLVFVRNRM